MSRTEHKPRRGEAVWVEGEKQPNGVIKYVDWLDGEPQTILVKFHETNEIKEFQYEEFNGSWDDTAFGGTWMVHKIEVNNGNQFL